MLTNLNTPSSGDEEQKDERESSQDNYAVREQFSNQERYLIFYTIVALFVILFFVGLWWLLHTGNALIITPSSIVIAWAFRQLVKFVLYRPSSKPIKYHHKSNIGKDG